MNRHTVVAALIAIAMFTIGLFSGASLQHDLDVQGFRSIDVHIIAPDPADDDTPMPKDARNL